MLWLLLVVGEKYEKLVNIIFTTSGIRVCRTKYEDNFNNEIKLAGKDWAQGFMRRNRELCERKPEPITVSRILAFKRIEVTQFNDNFLLFLGCASLDLIVSLMRTKVDFKVYKNPLQSLTVKVKKKNQVGLPQVLRKEDTLLSDTP
jgi:hypothetical protein